MIEKIISNGQNPVAAVALDAQGAEVADQLGPTLGRDAGPFGRVAGKRAIEELAVHAPFAQPGHELGREHTPRQAVLDAHARHLPAQRRVVHALPA